MHAEVRDLIFYSIISFQRYLNANKGEGPHSLRSRHEQTPQKQENETNDKS